MGLLKKIFTGLLTGQFNASSHTICVFLTNQKRRIQPITINLHPNEFIQGLRYYSFAVKLDR